MAPCGTRERARRARAWWPVDADGAEDNHAVATTIARARAVVALRALNNCTRLPRDCQGSCSPPPQALRLSRFFAYWTEIRAQHSIECHSMLMLLGTSWRTI
jgi:hypothetical protein